MINLTQNDLSYRLRTLQCCIGELTTKLLNKIKIGAKDIDCKLNELLVLQGMIEALNCYNVLTDDVTEEDNCLTEIQVQSMFDYMNAKCNNCVQFPGFVYTE